MYTNGEESHTHFLDSEKNITGKITGYTWTLVDTVKVVSIWQKFQCRLRLGATRFKFAVPDDSCTRNGAEKAVTITGKVRSEQYCYYYQEVEGLSLGRALLTETVCSSFASISSPIVLRSPTFSSDQTAFIVSFKFFLSINGSSAAEDSVEIDDSGAAKLYEGTDFILDSASASTMARTLPMGLIFLEWVYSLEDVAVLTHLRCVMDSFVPSNTLISHD